MEIHWNQNPADTSVILNDEDKKLLRANLHIENLEHILSNAAASLHLRNDVERAKKSVEWAKWSRETINEKIDEQVKIVCDALENGTHMGDCTCVAFSCEKCWAESLVGIDTISGLGKHGLYKIIDAMKKSSVPVGSPNIDEAIEILKNYEPKADWKGWEAHADRWRREAKQACDWLIEYRNEHFSGA